MHLIISEFLDEAALERIPAGIEWHYDPGLVNRRDDLLGLIADVPALIVRSYVRVDRDLLDHAPKLKVVGRLGVGLDNIDLEACRARGVQVAPATGANTRSVAEYTLAALLMLLRGAYHASDQVLAGDWPRERLMAGREVAGKTLGLVGFAAIGRAVAEPARALGMSVIASDPYVAEQDPAWAALGVERVELDALLARSHAVSLHVPLTPQTRHLLGAAQIARMRPDAVLINTARGGVLDDTALATALREGRLAGAMLDVFEDEPLPAGSPLVGVPNLLLTPHIAGLTREANERVGALVAARVCEILAGAGQ